MVMTVAEYLSVVNAQLDVVGDAGIEIVGEVVEFRVSQGKWVNFDLKDEEEEAKISCFMMVHQVRVPVEDGMRVRVIGSPKVYPRFGKFSLTVRDIQLEGEGALAKAYEALKLRLEKEGLFDVTRKRPIPRFPNSIGLITSSGAASYGDFLRILSNRFTDVDIVHVPVAVQGRDAVPDILNAFEYFERLSAEDRPDVLVLTRGGGSLEDLHAFNDEQVARAVFRSSIPVVVGVGHERDESLCDFVADVRASTPSNAGERVVPDRRELMRDIQQTMDLVEQRMTSALSKDRRLVELQFGRVHHAVQAITQEIALLVERFQVGSDRYFRSLPLLRDDVFTIQTRIQTMIERHGARTKESIERFTQLIRARDVRSLLKRGFAIARSPAGAILRSTKSLKDNDAISLELSDGAVTAVISHKHTNI